VVSAASATRRTSSVVVRRFTEIATASFLSA